MMESLSMDAFYASAIKAQDEGFDALRAAAAAVVERGIAGIGLSFGEWAVWPPKGSIAATV